ncbi:MAG: CPBP family intramembrane metalloprotease [Myxococcales bacterium]|nr:CPBP family intramembrane metalloprotease [Myxococcales bacterium]
MAAPAIFLRDGPDAPARAVAPQELVEADGETGAREVTASTLTSLSPEGPFTPLAAAVLTVGPLRDVLARTTRAPSLASWKKARVAAALGLVPVLMLLELDRELLAAGRLRWARLAVDTTFAIWITFEITRATPRRPGATAAVLACVAFRYLVLVTRVCGAGIHPAAYVAMGIAATCAGAFLVLAPSPARVTLEVLDKLGISKSDAIRARAPPLLPAAYVPAALAAAAGLPLLLSLVRSHGISAQVQASVFVGYALFVPPLVTRLFGAAAKPEPLRLPLAQTAAALLLGFVLALALANGARCFFDAGAYLARCTGKLDAAGRALLDAEARELTWGLARAKGQVPLAVLTTLVVPFAEERIYRGLVQRVLCNRYGQAYGVFGAAFVFGLAHMGVYHVALYQTALLGIAFGVAYLEGGIVAATLAHALWNLHVLL